MSNKQDKVVTTDLDSEESINSLGLKKCDVINSTGNCPSDAEDIDYELSRPARRKVNRAFKPIETASRRSLRSNSSLSINLQDNLQKETASKRTHRSNISISVNSQENAQISSLETIRQRSICLSSAHIPENKEVNIVENLVPKPQRVNKSIPDSVTLCVSSGKSKKSKYFSYVKPESITYHAVTSLLECEKTMDDHNLSFF